MNWKILLTTFGLLFLAELGDKTQLAVISLTAKHKTPWAVFIGASLAMATVTALGVIFGEVITRFIPGNILEKVSAGLFILIGILMFFDIF
ncbi:MAG: TMEM165/GDT1 family protein [Actinobacteria bacterium]|nr:TMEM165/GDT1 family protein [Actinomycetota bacterium]